MHRGPDTSQVWQNPERSTPPQFDHMPSISVEAATLNHGLLRIAFDPTGVFRVPEACTNRNRYLLGRLVGWGAGRQAP